MMQIKLIKNNNNNNKDTSGPHEFAYIAKKNALSRCLQENGTSRAGEDSKHISHQVLELGRLGWTWLEQNALRNSREHKLGVGMSPEQA